MMSQVWSSKFSCSAPVTSRLTKRQPSTNEVSRRISACGVNACARAMSSEAQRNAIVPTTRRFIPTFRRSRLGSHFRIRLRRFLSGSLGGNLHFGSNESYLILWDAHFRRRRREKVIGGPPLIFAVLALWFSAGHVPAAEHDAIPVVVADFDYEDTSGETEDRRAAHTARVKIFPSLLRERLAREDKYKVLRLDCAN